MDTQSGEAAGRMWPYLAVHGAATLPQVQRGTTLPERLVHGCDRSIPKIPQVAITMDDRHSHLSRTTSYRQGFLLKTGGTSR